MQFKTREQIDPTGSVLVIYRKVEELKTLPQVFVRAGELEAKAEHKAGTRLYRAYFAEGGDLYMLRLAADDDLRETQKKVHAATLMFNEAEERALDLLIAQPLSGDEIVQILKTIALAVPAKNPYSTDGLEPAKDKPAKAEPEEKESEQSEEEAKKLSEICLIGRALLTAEQEQELTALESSIKLTRRLVNAPANAMTPDRLAKEAIMIGEETGIDVTVMGQSSIEALGMKAYLSVAKGSSEEPRLIVMRYCAGEKDAPTLALVGKGITYDSGGYAVKPAAGMVTMHADMGGAAAVIGAIRALALSKAPVNVVAIVAACENMISGHAYRNGDIIGSMLGKFIDVGNTDAEGRLTLADAVTYAWQREKADYIIDIATLTGAAVVALGHIMTGVLSDDEELFAALQSASDASGDLIWRLPFHPDFAALNKTPRADIKNTGKDGAGTIKAGHFVRAFTGEKPFMHLDIAGTAYLDSADERNPMGATGVGVELLYGTAKNFFAVHTRKGGK